KDLSIKIKKEQAEALKDYEGKEIIFGCRPEDILIDDPSSYYDTEVDISELLGSEVLVHFNFDDVHFCAKTNKDIEDHTKIKIAFNIDKIHAFDKDTELAIF
ncbi:MAG: sugar ABC transporter ATP-binding protein, partial [Bacilli bacterium]|nr:sugar ABC transporter ATP-binding protein [Bacilli bacterium]